jgi:6-phosphogluconolactonase
MILSNNNQNHQLHYNMKKYAYTLVVLTMLFTSCKNETINGSAHMYHFYVGTYTQKEGHVDGKGEGVYKISIDMDKDSMKITHTIADFVNPSFLTLSDNQKHLYVVNEISPNANNYNARLSHIDIDSTGRHRKAQEAGTFGNAACHVMLNPKNDMVVVSNYLGGELAYGKLGANGNLSGEIKHKITNCKSINTARQEASHIHMAAFTHDGNKLVTADLGCDSLRVYQVDGTTIELHQINAQATQPGDGPRHFVFSDDDKFLYVVNELSNTVTSYAFDSKTGVLKPMTTISTLPLGYSLPSSCADIHLSQNGKTLYVSNRGHNSIATFQLDLKGGMNLLGHTPTDGKTPRNFAITKDGKYLIAANQDSDNLVVFAIGEEGKLNKKADFQLKTPVCIVESKF